MRCLRVHGLVAALCVTSATWGFGLPAVAADDGDLEFRGGYGVNQIHVDADVILKSKGRARSQTSKTLTFRQAPSVRPRVQSYVSGGLSQQAPRARSGVVRGPVPAVALPAWEVAANENVGLVRSTVMHLGCLMGITAYCPAVPVSSAPAVRGSGGGAVSGGGSRSVRVQEALVGVSLSDFTVLPIKASTVRADLGGFGLRHGVTNVYATGGVQTVNAEVLGQSVVVRARPVTWSFDYGDGSAPNDSAEPGGPLPAGVLEDSETAFETETVTGHRYEETGTYSLQVVTTFQGEYRVAGGEWVPIPGVTAVESDPFTVDIWRTRALHVSGPCQPGQRTAGCHG